MTKEEAIKKIKSFCHNCSKFPQCVNTDRECFEAIDMAIEALEQEPKWIPVSERLPEESITVIGITPLDDIYKAELYDDCGEKKWYADGNFDVPIVAWMPFTESYKEKDDMDAMLEHLWNDVADEESEVEK
jgi:hypothetical protein